MPVLEVSIETLETSGGSVRVSAQLRSPAGAEQLWYEADERVGLVERGDPFVLSALNLAMHRGCSLHVRGAPVSTSLLRNVEEFGRVWRAWFGFPIVEIIADDEVDDEPASGPAVVAFSGGVDSAFSTFTHVSGRFGRHRDVAAGVMVHGIDIPLSDPTGFVGAAARASRMLDDLGLPLLTVRTNAWELLPPRAHFAAMGVSSALHLVAPGFSAGLVPSTTYYGDLVFPIDSSPLSDPMLGSRSFEIVHDGAAYSRLEKLRRLAEWDVALDSVRVCLKDPRHDRNCGQCNKCVLTYLELRVLGIAARCFDLPPSAERIVEWAGQYPSHRFYAAEMRAVLREANARGLDEPWMRPARRRLRTVTAKDAVRMMAPSFAQQVRRLHRRVAHLR